jgi:hypothetical protein
MAILPSNSASSVEALIKVLPPTLCSLIKPAFSHL